MLRLSKAEAAAILAHAGEVFPLEACGVVLQSVAGRRDICHAQNVQDALHELNPALPPATEAYTMDPDTLRMIRDHRRAGGRLLIVYHSHTNGLAEFSRADRRQALGRLGIPHYPDTDHLVVALGGLLTQPRFVAARWDPSAERYRPVEVVIREPGDDV